LLSSKPDIVLYGNFAYWPTWLGAKSIAVIHDLSFIDVPEFVEAKNRKFLVEHTPYTIKNASHIVTISEHAKRRIMQQYKVVEDRISIVNPAIDHDIFYPRDKKEVEMVRKKFNLPQKYFLFVGTLEPRKNLVRLLDAYAKLDSSLQLTYPLVLVGGRGWADEEIQQRLIKYRELPIIRPGYVPDEDMPALYSGATALLWPTIYEGFGMPPLEAMTCGIPVLTSNTTSLPEVVGDSALMVDPFSVEDIRDGIHRLATDKGFRSQLSKRGLARSKRFSWEKSAKNLYDVMSRLIS
jgi:glycosyltransferase involved in cell wall biosynthesis